MKVAVFSCLGLGDGLITLVLSNNLRLAGHEVVTFHPFLKEVEHWFEGLKIESFDEVDLEAFDRYYIFYERMPRMQGILEECLRQHPDKTVVLNPIATPNCDYPYWEGGKFDGNLSFVENLYRFCSQRGPATRSNGIRQVECLFPRRIVLHPTSSRPGKNWSRRQFLKLRTRLQRCGFEPVFVVSPQEKALWPEAKSFDTLDALFTFVGQSGAVIGNDSGIGHLASALSRFTVTLCRNERTANFWRPGWHANEVLVPARYFPNLKGIRLRDRYWYLGISVRRVLKRFIQCRPKDRTPTG